MAEVVVLRARTVKEKDPNALGVPDSTPVFVSEVPVGSVPETTLYPVGFALDADRATLYKTEIAVFASVGLVTHAGGAVTSCVNDRSAVAFAAFPVARIVKENEPPALGVPLNRPPLDRDRPGGIDPDCTEYDTALVAVNCCEYADPVAKSANAPAAGLDHTGSATTVCVNALSA